MGNRGNIAIVYPLDQYGEQPARIYLYTHWGGSYLAHALQDALRRSAPEVDPGRWTMPEYLARIVFDSLKGDDVESTIGFGIAPYPPDNDHPILVLDLRHRMVYLEDDDPRDRSIRAHLRRQSGEAAPDAEARIKRSWTLDEFLAEDFGPGPEDEEPDEGGV